MCSAARVRLRAAHGVRAVCICTRTIRAQVLLGLERSTASRSVYAARMATINETMRYKGMPSKFQRRVRKFYEYLWLVEGAAANEADKAHPMKWLHELPTAYAPHRQAGRTPRRLERARFAPL